MLQKSPINGKWYNVDDLTLDEKMRHGFDKEVVSDLKEVNEQKKSPVKNIKKEPKKKISENDR